MAPKTAGRAVAGRFIRRLTTAMLQILEKDLDNKGAKPKEAESRLRCSVTRPNPPQLRYGRVTL